MTKGEGLENLAKWEYLGRVIIIGQIDDNNVVVYALTGRSPPSRARKLEVVGNNVKIEAIDEDTVKQGKVDLLLYDNAIMADRALLIANGDHMSAIDHSYFINGTSPMKVMTSAFSKNHSDKWSYEDDKYCTPRIGGIVMREDNVAVLGILKKAENDETLRYHFEFPLISGKGKSITTYAGPNVEPVPSFTGEPFDVELKGKTPEEIAEAVYEALKPEQGKDDFRVSVAVAFQERDINNINNKFFRINRSERGE